MNPISTNGNVTLPAGATPPVKIIDSLDGGPLTGRKGEAVLEKVIEKAFLTPTAPVSSAGGSAGAPAPATAAPAGAAASPANLTPAGNAGTEEPTETPEQKATRETQEESNLLDRATANGVGVEEQRTAETAELERLQAVASRTGETIEQVAEREEAGGAEPVKPGKTYSQVEVERIVNERITQIKTENEELRKRGSAPAGQGPLGEVFDPAKLEELKAETRVGIKYTGRLLQMLQYAPDKVETELRSVTEKNPKVAAKFADESGAEDFSIAKMAEVLSDSMDGLTTTRDELIPDREKFLADYQQKYETNHKLALQLFPWINQQGDQRQALLADFLQTTPYLKQLPGHEYWLACAIEKHLEKIAAHKANGNGAARATKFVPKVKFPATARRGGGFAPRVPADALKAAKEQLRKTGSERDLDKVLALAFGSR